MIGQKKLVTIREELQQAWPAAGDDLIRWLEDRMAAAERQGAAASGESEVLQSLRRVLEATGTEKRRRQQVGPKK